MTINTKKLSEIDQTLFTSTTSLINHVYWIQQDFSLIPNKEHYGTCINYVDLQEYRDEFIDELVSTISEWVYSSKAAKKILTKMMDEENRSEQNANFKLRNIAVKKFRSNNSDTQVLQGQFGELLLFNFLQHFFSAVPLLRKMPITTSSGFERFGVDAIHYNVNDNKHIFFLGESKAYISAYSFKNAFNTSLKSIIDSYENHRKELDLYLYDDFLDDSLIEIAKDYKNGTIRNMEIHLVCLVAYNETEKVKKQSEDQIKADIMKIIKARCNSLEKGIFSNIDNSLLSRINYIIFPIWDLENLITTFQRMVGK